MQVIQIMNQEAIRSKGNGTAAKYISSPIDAALGAKTIVLYITVHETDTNARITGNWAHGVDGENWAYEGTPMVDSGEDATPGVLVGNNGDTVFGSKVRFTIEIEEDTTGGGNQKQAIVSVAAVFKPF